MLTEGSSLAASTRATVDKRIARARGAIREVKSVMEDFRRQAIGGMAGAWDLWKAGICASLLANSGTWVKLNKEEVKKLNDLFHEFLRNIYSCPPSTPLPALRSQAGKVSMEYLVDREKICLVGKLLHRTEPGNYARQVLEEQIMMGWEGIAKEAREICTKLGLPDKYTKFPVCCPHCPEGRSVGVPESPAHWLECSSYRDLRQGVDPELVLKDRCKFIRKVIDKRKKLEDELSKE